jgi:hypothetical protein
VAVLDAAGSTYKLMQLNDHWSVALAPDFESLSEASVAAPILYFQHAGDHGWAYAIDYQGETLAEMEISFEASFYLAVEQWEQAYPDKDPYDDETGAFAQMVESAEASDAYREIQTQEVANANVEQFRLFGLDDGAITELGRLLAPDWQGSPFDRVAQFKELLGIPEMSWVSYEYEDADESDE